MNLFRVFSGQQGQAVDGVLVGSGEARGLADAVVVGQVFKDVEGSFLWQSGGEKRGSLAFREACVAGAATEEAYFLAWSRPSAVVEVPGVFLSKQGAFGILTAEVFNGAHGRYPWRRSTGIG